MTNRSSIHEHHAASAAFRDLVTDSAGSSGGLIAHAPRRGRPTRRAERLL